MNIQGSEGVVDDVFKDTWIDSLERQAERNEQLYDMANEFGIANELSRISLPLSTYTQWFWKIDLRNFFHFLKLRLDVHAQNEIRLYAEAMFKLVKEKFPMACEAFEDYMLYAETFSKQEMLYMSDYFRLLKAGYPPPNPNDYGLANLEYNEFENKMKKWNK